MIAYDDEAASREADQTVDRINAKFQKWLENYVVGKSVAELSGEQIKKTMQGIIRAELGQLQGTGRRPVMTPRHR